MTAFHISRPACYAASSSVHSSSKVHNLEPVKSLANASAQCSSFGHAYAQCIFAAQFGTEGVGVEKDICQKEFNQFKNCVQEKVMYE